MKQLLIGIIALTSLTTFADELKEGFEVFEKNGNSVKCTKASGCKF